MVFLEVRYSKTQHRVYTEVRVTCPLLTTVAYSVYSQSCFINPYASSKPRPATECPYYPLVFSTDGICFLFGFDTGQMHRIVSISLLLWLSGHQSQYDYGCADMDTLISNNGWVWPSLVSKQQWKTALIHKTLHCPLPTHALYKCHWACTLSRRSTTQGDTGCPQSVCTKLLTRKEKRSSYGNGTHVRHMALTERESTRNLWQTVSAALATALIKALMIGFQLRSNLSSHIIVRH